MPWCFLSSCLWQASPLRSCLLEPSEAGKATRPHTTWLGALGERLAAAWWLSRLLRPASALMIVGYSAPPAGGTCCGSGARPSGTWPASISRSGGPSGIFPLGGGKGRTKRTLCRKEREKATEMAGLQGKERNHMTYFRWEAERAVER